MPTSPPRARIKTKNNNRTLTKITYSKRATAHERGYTGKWQKASKQHLSESPLCVKCLESGTYTPATEVDHIIPHRGNMELFWNIDNWQSLCKPCHSKKTASGE